MKHYDIIISGGGIVGLAIACGLQGIGLQVLIVECTKYKRVLNDDTIIQNTERFSALNVASKRFLQHLGIWQKILDIYATNPFYGVEVWDMDGCGKINFDSQKQRIKDPLGYIVSNQELHHMLWQYVQNSKDITIFTSVKFHNVSFESDHAILTLENGSVLSTYLVIAADGTHSWIREHANIPLTFWDYRHHALVATIRTEKPHQSVAYQIFHSESILAFLPLSDPYLSSIVWSVSPEKASFLQTTSEILFNQYLSISHDLRLGLCRLASKRQTLPLTGCYAHNFAQHRLALVGNSAHTIHPLIGQGLNLGLMDAAELISEIKRIHYQCCDIGQYKNLRAYERRRKYSALLMLMGAQGFYLIFHGNHAEKKILRNSLLMLVNQMPAVKFYLLQHAQGIINIPQWLLR
ncbi:2-octaprenylphenol hydroxylase [Candidatus Erwinia haradaeae]|uniref:2-octaprenylphenol hydroxylase n=1 Tax=Candidatus Erwinia haradaeae TaxID=1922217 RepID=A0A451DDN6_9GAMM|nr:FAD-dependent monooxygenase [Candidatus Erwinia haradaeae]VFP84570.1 2-octaprenylphenol hydroxylase [Candidatus Erwinia haradaeae]